MLLAHLSDLHFGAADDDALAATLRCVQDRRPDGVIITGDITRAGLETEFNAAFDWIRNLPAPALVTPGNHDVPYYNLAGRLFDPFGRFRRAATGVHLDSWHAPKWSLTAINTARGLQPRLNWAQGAVSSAQQRDAARDIAAAPAGALNIVATHHPLDWPDDAPIHGRTWGGRVAQNAFVDAGAQLLLSGHLHVGRAFAVGRGRAIAVSAGTLSQRLRNEAPGFTLLHQNEPQAIDVEFMQIAGGRAETRALQSFRLSNTSR